MVLCTLFMACEKKTNKEVNETITPQPDKVQSNDWIYLFDGKTTKGWRAYEGDSLPPKWFVEEGVLTFDTELMMEDDYTGGADIIYGLEEFDNFE